MRWRTRFVCTAMPIARPIASPHRRSASCTRSTPVAPPPWTDVSSALPTTASNVPPTTPAAIAIVPSVNRSRRPGGLRLGRRSCCPSFTFTPSSPCPTISTRSSLRTTPSYIRSLENGRPDPQARRVVRVRAHLALDPGGRRNQRQPTVFRASASRPGAPKRRAGEQTDRAATDDPGTRSREVQHQIDIAVAVDVIQTGVYRRGGGRPEPH